MQKSPDAFRTISEVADWLDTPAHVLRFWESRFTQIKPIKRAGGRRYYRPADMALLGGIKKLLHEDGMTIRGVQKLLREHGVKYVAAMSPEVEGYEIDESAVSATDSPIPPAPMAEDVPQAPDMPVDEAAKVVQFARQPEAAPEIPSTTPAQDVAQDLSDPEEIAPHAPEAPLEATPEPTMTSLPESDLDAASFVAPSRPVGPPIETPMEPETQADVEAQPEPELPMDEGPQPSFSFDAPIDVPAETPADTPVDEPVAPEADAPDEPLSAISNILRRADPTHVEDPQTLLQDEGTPPPLDLGTPISTRETPEHVRDHGPGPEDASADPLDTADLSEADAPSPDENAPPPLSFASRRDPAGDETGAPQESPAAIAAETAAEVPADAPPPFIAPAEPDLPATVEAATPAIVAPDLPDDPADDALPADTLSIPRDKARLTSADPAALRAVLARAEALRAALG